MYSIAKVLCNRIITDGFARLDVSVPPMAAEAQPGQFVMLKCWQGVEPFLMRPFSINSADREKGTLSFLYKIVGKGTEILSAVQTGAEIELIGPLGNGFPIFEDSRRIAVIGRGVGAAPMRFLAEEAVRRGIETRVYLSAGKPEQLFDAELYRALGCEVKVTTDPNVNVTSFFAEDCGNMAFQAAYICGSKRLTRDVAMLSKEHGFKAYVSLEEHMACGFGQCKGCVVSVRDKDGNDVYVTVCKNGPVFPVERLV